MDAINCGQYLCDGCKKYKRECEYSLTQIRKGNKGKCKKCIYFDAKHNHQRAKTKTASIKKPSKLKNETKSLWAECNKYNQLFIVGKTRRYTKTDNILIEITNLFKINENNFILFCKDSRKNEEYNRYGLLFTINCSIYNIITNKWTNPRKRYLSIFHKDIIYTISMDPNAHNLYILYIDPRISGTVNILKFDINNLSELKQTYSFHHNLNLNMEILSVFINNELHILQNKTHFIWKQDENKLIAIDTLKKMKFNGSKLLYLRSQNGLLLINGYDNVWFFCLNHQFWIKWKIERIGFTAKMLFPLNINRQKFDYILTDNDKYIVIICNLKGRTKINSDWKTKWNQFFAVDIDNKLMYNMILNGPQDINEYKGIMMNEEASNQINGILIYGFFNKSFKWKQILPIDLWRIILIWYGMDTRLHLIGNNGNHQKINLNAILKEND